QPALLRARRGKMGGRLACGRHPGFQRGFLVHQWRSSAHGPAPSRRAFHPDGLRHAAVRRNDRGFRGVYTSVVDRLDPSLGCRPGIAEALLPGQPTVISEATEMRAYLLSGLMICGLLFAAGQTSAHHSFTAEFDGNKPITLTGTVTKVEWTNPH